MNKQHFVANTHFHPNVNDNGQLLSNTKAGWQSSKVTNSTQNNIKASMEQISDMILDGTIKDGSIITTYTQITFTKDALPMQTEGMLVDGKPVERPALDAADETEIPF